MIYKVSITSEQFELLAQRALLCPGNLSVSYYEGDNIYFYVLIYAVNIRAEQRIVLRSFVTNTVT